MHAISLGSVEESPLIPNLSRTQNKVISHSLSQPNFSDLILCWRSNVDEMTKEMEVWKADTEKATLLLRSECLSTENPHPIDVHPLETVVAIHCTEILTKKTIVYLWDYGKKDLKRILKGGNIKHIQYTPSYLCLVSTTEVTSKEGVKTTKGRVHRYSATQGGWNAGIEIPDLEKASGFYFQGSEIAFNVSNVIRFWSLENLMQFPPLDTSKSCFDGSNSSSCDFQCYGDFVIFTKYLGSTIYIYDRRIKEIVRKLIIPISEGWRGRNGACGFVLDPTDNNRLVHFSSVLKNGILTPTSGIREFLFSQL